MWQNYTFEKSASVTGLWQNYTFGKSASASVTGCASASATGCASASVTGCGKIILLKTVHSYKCLE